MPKTSCPKSEIKWAME